MSAGFSALQRAENSSLVLVLMLLVLMLRFSALQRAENSSPDNLASVLGTECLFQCSSASRKFLTRHARRQPLALRMFQCSSASRKFLTLLQDETPAPRPRVSVLFSEPKIPHRYTV